MKTPASAACTCRAKACCMPASPSTDPLKVITDPSVAQEYARRWPSGRRIHFEKADEVMRRNSRRVVRAPRIMSKYYRAILELLVARGFALPRAPVRLNKTRPHRHYPSLRFHLMQKTVHIIGAGISGLSAAVRLANANYQGACPRGHAAGRRPLPVLFRCGDQPDHRQRQSSPALGQPPARSLTRGRSAPRRGWSGRSARNFRSST